MGWGGVVLGVVLVAPGIASAQAAAAPTFTKDIAPIFQEKCEACHRPDSIAPMSLQTYRRGAAVGPVHQARVVERGRCRHGTSTRPWASRSSTNDRSLSDDQITTIVRWIDQGAPRGNAKRHAGRKAWPEGQGWNYAAGSARPNRTSSSCRTDYTMPAALQDAWDQRLTPTGITEPRWVRAIEIRPKTVKGRRITHHAIAYLRPG